MTWIVFIHFHTRTPSHTGRFIMWEGLDDALWTCGVDIPRSHWRHHIFTARESLHKRTHTDRHTHIWREVWTPVLLLYYHFFFFPRVTCIGELGICFTFPLRNFDSWVHGAEAAAATEATKVTFGAVIRRKFDTRPGKKVTCDWVSMTEWRICDDI